MFPNAADKNFDGFAGSAPCISFDLVAIGSRGRGKDLRISVCHTAHSGSSGYYELKNCYSFCLRLSRVPPDLAESC